MSERADFLERLSRLAGQTTYRVPVEGIGTRFGLIPESHGLIVTLCGARGKKWHPGPEVAYAYATGIPVDRAKVLDWLSDKLYLGTGSAGRRYADRVGGIAAISYHLATRGADSTNHYKFDQHVMRLAKIGACWLAACMDDTISRAEKNERIAA